MCIVHHELLQFIGIQNFDGNFGPSKNNEDEFSYITGLLSFYQNDKVSENSHLPYENNKKKVGLTSYHQC